MSESEINFRAMPRNLMIQALNIHPETFDSWITQGAPIESGKGKTALHDIGKILVWRVEKEKAAKKNLPKPPKENDKPEQQSDPEVLIKMKTLEQDLRKKIRENDLADGYLCDKKQTEDRYFRLGRALRDNLMSKDSVWGPSLSMVSGFEASVYLRKEMERFCNSIADLNLLDDEALAREFHEYFMAGVNYKNVH